MFLYNLGKGYTGQCTAEATSEIFQRFGTQALGIGNWAGRQLDNFMVSQYGGPGGEGIVNVFSGNSVYGPVVSVTENKNKPMFFRLSQNYPNPFADECEIDLSCYDPRLYGAAVTIKLYDIFGNFIRTIYTGRADGFGYTIRMNAAGLSAGTYFYRLACGGYETMKMMTIVR